MLFYLQTQPLMSGGRFVSSSQTMTTFCSVPPHPSRSCKEYIGKESQLYPVEKLSSIIYKMEVRKHSANFFIHSIKILMIDVSILYKLSQPPSHRFCKFWVCRIALWQLLIGQSRSTRFIIPGRTSELFVLKKIDAIVRLTEILVKDLIGH